MCYCQRLSTYYKQDKSGSCVSSELNFFAPQLMTQLKALFATRNPHPYTQPD